MNEAKVMELATAMRGRLWLERLRAGMADNLCMSGVHREVDQLLDAILTKEPEPVDWEKPLQMRENLRPVEWIGWAYARGDRQRAIRETMPNGEQYVYFVDEFGRASADKEESFDIINTPPAPEPAIVELEYEAAVARHHIRGICRAYKSPDGTVRIERDGRCFGLYHDAEEVGYVFGPWHSRTVTG